MPDGAPVHYQRHRPEQTTRYRLVQLVQQDAATFIAETEVATAANMPRGDGPFGNTQEHCEHVEHGEYVEHREHHDFLKSGVFIAFAFSCCRHIQQLRM